jgi:NADPH-dependent 7-cyano-7-deazaguanine reductase QueF-like protein
VSKDIWNVLRRVNETQLSEKETEDILVMSKYLKLLLDKYEDSRFSRMTEVDLWLAREIVNAVDELI